MLTMNFKARLLSKTWWVGIISLIILLSQQCGFDLSQYVPSNYEAIINTIFTLFAAIGITVDTSTPGVSDQVISGATVQVINQDNETKEAVKVEDTTTAINNTVTENSQDSSANASAASSDKESEITTNVQAVNNITLDAATQAAVLAAAQAALQANNSIA